MLQTITKHYNTSTNKNNLTVNQRVVGSSPTGGAGKEIKPWKSSTSEAFSFLDIPFRPLFRWTK